MNPRLVNGCLGVFIAASFSTLVCLAEDKASTRRAIEEVSKRWDDAAIERDVASLNEVLADDFFCVAADGRTMNKRQFIEYTTSDNVSFDKIATDHVALRVYENTAVETGRVTSQGTKDGRKFRVQMRYVAVYVLNEFRWQATVYQATPIR